MDTTESSHSQEMKTGSHVTLALIKITEHQAETETHVNLKTDAPFIVANYLLKLYTDLQKKDEWSNRKIKSMRSAIQKFISDPPNPRTGLNIITDREFKIANSVLSLNSERLDDIWQSTYELEPKTSSDRQMKWVAKLLKQHQEEIDDYVDFKTDSPETIDQYLQKFYHDFQNKPKSNSSTLRCIRAALQKYIISPPNPRRDINICDDNEFKLANKAYHFVQKHCVKNAHTKHNILSCEDFGKIKIFLTAPVYENPQNLLYGAWFVLLYFFSKQRGRGLSNLVQNRDNEERYSNGKVKPILSWEKCFFSDLNFQQDEEGAKFVTLEDNFREFPKLVDPLTDCIKLYDKPEYKPNPYQILKTYCDHISSMTTPDTRLLLYPNPHYRTAGDDQWYYTQKPVGRNALSGYMKSFSKLLNLDKSYNNPSVVKFASATSWRERHCEK